MKRLHEHHRSDAETVCELHNIDKTNVSLPALDATHIVAVQTSKFSQLLLGQIAFHPELACSFAEDDTGVG